MLAATRPCRSSVVVLASLFVCVLALGLRASDARAFYNGQWVCDPIPAGYSYDAVRSSSTCPGGIEYRLITPADGVDVCMLTGGFVYERVASSSDCTTAWSIGGGLKYHLRTPADGVDACGSASGFTYDHVWRASECETPSSFGGGLKYHLRKPADDVDVCTWPGGFTYDHVWPSSDCETPSSIGGGIKYHLRTPRHGIDACWVPPNFTSEPGREDGRCTTPSSQSKGYMYRLIDPNYHPPPPPPLPPPAPTLGAAPTALELAPPATGSSVVTWTNTDPAYANASIFYRHAGATAWTYLASAGASGSTSASIATPDDYEFGLFSGPNPSSTLLKSVHVRSTVRSLTSVSPGVTRRPDGKVDVFVRAGGGMASMATLTWNGRVSTPWSSLGLPVVGAPSGSWSADGRTLDVFAIDTAHRVMTRRYTAAGGWGAWAPVDGGGTAGCEQGNTAAWCETVGVARNASGVAIFIRDSGGNARMKLLDNAGQKVGDWQSLGKLVTGAPSGSYSPDGRTLTVTAVGADYKIYLRRLTGTTWTAWTREPGNGEAYSGTVELAGRANGQKALLVLGSGGTVYREIVDATGGLVSPGWVALNLAAKGAPSASWLADGSTLDIVAVDSGNRVLRAQWLEGGIWKDWTNSQVASATVSVAGRDALTGLPDEQRVYARGNDGAAYYEALTPTGALRTAWTALGSDIADMAPAASLTSNGNTYDEVVLEADHQIRHRERTLDGAWTAWSAVAGTPPTATDIALASTADRWAITARGSDGVGWALETRRGQQPGPWRQLGGPLLGAPALSYNVDGTLLDTVGVATNRHIYRRQRTQDAAGEHWTPWIEVPGGGSASTATVGLAAFRDPATQDDKLTILVRGSNGEAYLQNTSRAGSTTSTWAPMGQQVLGAPAAYWSRDAKTIDVFAVAPDFNVRRRHGVRNVAWDPWDKIPGGGSAPWWALPTATPVAANPSLVTTTAALPVMAPSPSDAAVQTGATGPAPAPSGMLPGT